MTEQDLLTLTLISETKDINDAIAIAHVIMNRARNPKRFGEGIKGVILKPNQFSSVGGNEWKKYSSGKLSQAEAEQFAQFRSLAGDVIMGAVSDPTGGADHYFNPKLVMPSWSKGMKQQYKTDSHEYYKE